MARSARNLAPVPKKIRFEVFRRDGFACRYCGRQPPGIVLELDHVAARSSGGTNDPLNLITSCAGCNSGKAARTVDVPPHVRPDADLEYLALAQERAEIERYLSAKVHRDELEGRLLALLQAEWQRRLPTGYEVVPERILRNWLERYTPDDIEEAIRRAAPYADSGYLDPSTAVNYVFGILRRVARERSAPSSDQRGDRTH